MTVLYYLFLFLFLGLSALLCLLILVQESKSMGLGASFGGDSGNSLFGTSTAEVLKRVTAWMIGLFMMACLILSLWTSVLGKETNGQQASSWAKLLKEKQSMR